MHIIILIAVVIILAYLAFVLVKATLVAWAAATALYLIALEAALMLFLGRWRKPDFLSKVLTVSAADLRLNWRIDTDRIDAESNYAAGAVGLVSFLGSLIVGAFTFNRFLESGVMAPLLGQFPTASAKDLTILALAVTVVVLGIATYVYKPRKRFRKALYQQVRAAADSFGDSIADLSQVTPIKDEISQIAREMEFVFPTDYQSAVREYVEAHSAEALASRRQLDARVAGAVQQATNDLAELRRAKEGMELTRAQVSGFMRLAVASGRVSLVDEADQIVHGLRSENLTNLLIERKWEDYHRILEMIRSDIATLATIATKPEEKNAAQDRIDFHKMSYEAACGILGVPVGADISDVARVYRALVSLWHPDPGRPDSERIRALNVAYDVINKHHRQGSRNQ